ncbi:3-oxoacyl-[acyl-carrier-protein] reductase [Planctomycetota bacterium]
MSIELTLSGHVALVTGASRGIGHTVAFRLAEAGADVAVCARSLEPLEALASEIGNRFSVRSLAVAGDVCDREAVDKTVERVRAELGRVDVLVNNAGVTRDGLVARMTDDAWDDVLNTNLKGAFHFTRAVARPMMKQRSGRIINISSIVGLRGNSGQANYAASKAGLIGLTKAVARELSGRGITANVVAPGLVESDMTTGLADSYLEAIRKEIPLGRLGSAQEVADAVLFLAGPLAAYVTGTVLRVDGGLAM